MDVSLLLLTRLRSITGTTLTLAGGPQIRPANVSGVHVIISLASGGSPANASERTRIAQGASSGMDFLVSLET